MVDQASGGGGGGGDIHTTSNTRQRNLRGGGGGTKYKSRRAMGNEREREVAEAQSVLLLLSSL
jgi:hypothetical protein